MTRTVLTTVLAALAAVGVGAQGPTALQPSQRAELYKRNQRVIERLVEKTVVSARAPNNPVTRAESYDQVLYEFTQAIHRAKADKDPARVADLTKNLNSLISRGLKPTLDSAQKMVDGGTGKDEYVQTRDHLIAQVETLLSMLDDPATKAILEQTRTSLMKDVGK
ncbi:MAG TPA: hypothetical protein VM597_41230 [Gemmataceae bacterium]|jgi:hypothetical protein|nr:hypothetical protein [Gemmataceae bacterium]